jgi:predicted DNA-binding transcriptional regulator AlpA
MRVIIYRDLKSKKGIDYSREWLRQLERRGLFPKRFSMGNGKHKCWDEDEIDKHLIAMAKLRDETGEEDSENA